MYKIEQLETELVDMKVRINAFEARSKASIQSDRSLMLLGLQRSVESVEGTMLYVNTDKSRLTHSHEYDDVATASSKALTSQALACRHLEDIETTFTGLYTTATTGLERIEHMKKSFDDMDGELVSFRFRLASFSGRTRTALASARQALDAENADMIKTKTELESARVELQTLGSQIGHRKIARNALRVVGNGLLIRPL